MAGFRCLTTLVILLTLTSTSLAQERNVTLAIIWNEDGMSGIARNIFDRIFLPQLNETCHFVENVNQTGFNFVQIVQQNLLNLQLAKTHISSLQSSTCLFAGTHNSIDLSLYKSARVDSGVSDLSSAFASMQLHAFASLPISIVSDGIRLAMESAFSVSAEPDQQLAIVIGEEYQLRDFDSILSAYPGRFYAYSVMAGSESATLSAVKATGVANILLAAGSQVAEAFLTAAFNSMMLGPKYRWFFYNTRLVDKNDFEGFKVISRNLTSMEFGPINTAISNNLTLIREIYLYDLLSIWTLYLNKIVCKQAGEVNETYEGMTGNFKLNPDGSVLRQNWKMSFYRGLGGEREKIGNWSSDGEFNFSPPETRIPTDDVLRSEINKNPFKVSIVLAPPQVQYKPGFENNMNYTLYDRLEGFTVDMCKEVLKNLSIETVEFILQTDGAYGSPDSSGNWNGMVGRLIDGEANLVCGPLSVTAERSKVIKFANSLLTYQVTILYKQAQQNPLEKMFEFLNPFHYITWIGVVGSVIVLSIVLSVLHFFSKNSANFSLYDSIFFSFASLIQGITGTPPDRPSGQLVIAIYWLFAFVVLVAYVSNYAAMRLLATLQAEITGLSSLLSQSTYEYGFLANSSYQTAFETSSTTVMQQVYQHVLESPATRMPTNFEDAIQMVNNSTYAFINSGLVNNYYQQSMCNVISTGGFSSDSMAFGLPLTAEYDAMINKAINALIESGIRDTLFNKYFTVKDKPNCSSTKFPDVIRDYIPSEPASFNTKSGALTLSNTLGIAVINVIGCVLTLLLALVEFVFEKCRDWHRRRKTGRARAEDEDENGVFAGLKQESRA